MSLETQPDFVADDEILYRSIPVKTGYDYSSDGQLNFSSSAFQDRYQKPSVDRAKLCNNDPKHTQQKPTDGVIKLIVGEIREEIVEVESTPLRQYALDVIPDPIEASSLQKANLAHALIISNPQYHNDTGFRKAQRRLAYIATQNNPSWLIPPQE